MFAMISTVLTPLNFTAGIGWQPAMTAAGGRHDEHTTNIPITEAIRNLLTLARYTLTSEMVILKIVDL